MKGHDVSAHEQPQGGGDEWEQTFNAVSEPICVLTPDFRIVHANEAYRRLFGLGSRLVVGHPCYTETHGQLAPCLDCPLPRTLASQQPSSTRREWFIPVEPGGGREHRVFEVWTYPVREGTGAVVRLVEILKDITEPERLREAQQQAAALRAADQLKAELLGTVSHELRSPLAAIKGYAATLRRHEPRLSPQERYEFLTAIDEASERLTRIIEQLLAMAQLETGLLTLHRTPLDLARLTREAVAVQEQQHQPAQRPTRPTFSLHVRDEQGAEHARPVLVYADPNYLQAIVDQLLENAVKYSPEGGTIEVALSPLVATDGAARRQEQLTSTRDDEDIRTHPSQQPQQHLVELTISDQGMGIPSEHLGRIFETFHRVDTRLTREVDGLGVGLAMCRRLVELHGGAIWVESEPDKGSVFHVLLPAAETQSE